MAGLHPLDILLLRHLQPRRQLDVVRALRVAVQVGDHAPADRRRSASARTARPSLPACCMPSRRGRTPLNHRPAPIPTSSDRSREEDQPAPVSRLFGFRCSGASSALPGSTAAAAVATGCSFGLTRADWQTAVKKAFARQIPPGRAIGAGRAGACRAIGTRAIHACGRASIPAGAMLAIRCCRRKLDAACVGMTSTDGTAIAFGQVTHACCHPAWTSSAASPPLAWSRSSARWT